MTEKENKLILYKDEEGRVSVNVRFADEDVWLTREHLAQIYATTPQNISLHIGNIYHDKELGDEATRKKFFLVRQEGKRQVQREIDHYNLKGTGAVSHQEAIEKAEREFEIYREREMRLLESDFDKVVKSLLDKNNKTKKEGEA